MITTGQIRDALKKAVEKHGPDHVDPNALVKKTCLNVYRDKKGKVTARCIAAEALHTLGATDELLEKYNSRGVYGVVHELDLEIEHDALRLLGRAQDRQDQGFTWGEVAVALGIE